MPFATTSLTPRIAAGMVEIAAATMSPLSTVLIANAWTQMQLKQDPKAGSRIDCPVMTQYVFKIIFSFQLDYAC